jgi:hypothetical protein
MQWRLTSLPPPAQVVLHWRGVALVRAWHSWRETTIYGQLMRQVRGPLQGWTCTSLLQPAEQSCAPWG